MNRIFKTIRKALTGQTVAVSEHAKGQGKARNRSIRKVCSRPDSEQNSARGMTHQYQGSIFHAMPLRLRLPAQVLCLTLFFAIALTPAQASDDLYVYAGGGGGGGVGVTAGPYHAGGGGGGYIGTIDGGAGNGGSGSDWDSGGIGGGSTDVSLNGADSTSTQVGIGGGSGPYAGSAGAVFSGGEGGHGGDGGSIIAPIISSIQFNNIVMGAGEGGQGGQGGNSGIGGLGGHGGNIALTLNADATVLGNITLKAGDGGSGNGYPMANAGGAGGGGGNVSLSVTNSLTISGDITLTNGNNGSPGTSILGGGAGGGVYFGYTDAGLTASNYTLIFADNNGAGHNVRLTNNDGEAKFNASGLTLTAGGTAGTVNTVNFTGVSDYDSLSLGKLTLNGHNALSFDSDGSAAIGDIYIFGMNNTISNNATNLTMQSGKTLNFDLTGLSSADNGNSILNINGGNLTAHSGGTSVTVNIPSLNSADFNWGDSVTLADLSSGTFNYTSTSGGMVAASNYQLSYAVALDSTNALKFLVNGLTADTTYIGSHNTNMVVESGMFYKNQGVLNFSGNMLTVNNGGDFYTGVLDLTGTSSPTLNFSTATAWNALSQTGVGFGDLHLGNLNVDGTAGIGLSPFVNGTLGSNYLWSGNLYVNGRNNNLASFTNSTGITDLSGKIITFNLATNLSAGNILLTTSNANLTGSSIAMTVATINGVSGTLNSLHTGDQIILIKGIDQATWGGNQTEVTTSSGAIDYTFGLGTEQKNGSWNLISTLGLEYFNDNKAHNALMSASAMSLLLTQGGDRAAALSSKFALSDLGSDQSDNILSGFYLDIGGGQYEMKTGSHVESNNFHLLLGPAFRFNREDGAKTDLGLFFETGWGDFDTYNSFYRGNGDTSYYGVGLLARHDMTSGLYGEVSLRLGHAKSEYDSKYKTNYDISSTYYGGHLGLGYILPVSEAGNLDFSSKLLYTHLGSDSDINDSGDRMAVGATDSIRSQLGVKYAHQINDKFNVFVRAAWDYEFDGKTTGRYNRYRISKTDSSGSTGIGEIGFKLGNINAVSLDFSGYGLIGQRKGVGASIRLNYSF